MKIKYIVFMSDESERSYELSTIKRISFDYAKNILEEKELQENGFQPFEMITVVTFYDGTTFPFVTTDWEMYFD